MHLSARLLRGLPALLVLLSLVVGPALRAEDDPDTEVARRLFKQGSALYIAGDYQKALGLFEQARLAKPLPAFDFNIARCHDRLGKWTEALAEYQRFAAVATDDEDLKEANARIAVLRDRLHGAPARAAADEHYKKAIFHHNAGEWAKAVDEFKQAHKASPDPLYLYNIANSYRAAHDNPSAVGFYESFLRAAPSTPLRKNVESRIAELKSAAPAPPRALPALKTAAPAGAPGAPIVSERLKPVQELIKANRPRFRACFDAWGDKHPGVGGKVNLGFYLDPDGVINQATAELTGFEAPEVAECIVEFARTLDYPAATNGRYTRFNYPFDFKPN